MKENGTESLQLSSKQRRNMRVLLVEPDDRQRSALKGSLESLGYGEVSDTADYASALRRLPERKFTHVLFSTRAEGMDAGEFLLQVFKNDPSITAIPSSYDLDADDVFELLITGARGFLVLPYTQESLDQSIVIATCGQPIPDPLLHSENRNKVLVQLLVTNLDEIAEMLYQKKRNPRAAQDLSEKMASFRSTAGMARAFADGGPEQFLKTLEEFCIARAQGPVTRLGRVRERLAKRRATRRKS